VRIRLEQSGGFAAIPGLSKPVEVDTARLGADDTATLERLVRRTGLLDGSLRSAAGPPSGADLREYTLTVEDFGETWTAHLRDPLDNPAVGELVAHLQALRHRAAEETP
jgi:Emfourin